MIVYQANKAQFSEDVFNDQIEAKILEEFRKKLHHSTSESEINSWSNSLQYMDRVLRDPAIPANCGVAIEYTIPQSSKRLDFVLTGLNNFGDRCAILIELKQWSTATLSPKDAILLAQKSRLHYGEALHPSYQAWSYKCLIEGYNEAVEKMKIDLQPCAYLHNYTKDNVITNDHYKFYLEKAPVFLKGDAERLRDFIKTYIRVGDNKEILYQIENGRIRPSKMLADKIASMLKGNPEFILIDDQKIAFESGLSLLDHTNKQKKVLIVQGGPGSGKTVVAVNLLVSAIQKGKMARYVSKNAAPRAVYEHKLAGSIRKSEISHLFGGSGSFIDTESGFYDLLIVDEAHRLNTKSGIYRNLGENQIKEIIAASKNTVFFIDEDQRVTLSDIGTQEEIKKWAYSSGADVQELSLSSQFRCSGSEGYLSWLDNTLQIRETANSDAGDTGFDLKVFSSPSELYDAIRDKNEINNKARMVAGYCWDWKSKKDPIAYDIEMPQFKFHMRWNLTKDGSLWIIEEESVSEIGCIHTCQGLEVDYVGVIIGPDLVVHNGKVCTFPEARSSMDRSVRGYRKLLQQRPETRLDLDRIIKNTYRTLMTRGMRGCYLYCTDPETEAYFQEAIAALLPSSQAS